MYDAVICIVLPTSQRARALRVKLWTFRIEVIPMIHGPSTFESQKGMFTTIESPVPYSHYERQTKALIMTATRRASCIISEKSYPTNPDNDLSVSDLKARTRNYFSPTRNAAIPTANAYPACTDGPGLRVLTSARGELSIGPCHPTGKHPVCGVQSGKYVLQIIDRPARHGVHRGN